MTCCEKDGCVNINISCCKGNSGLQEGNNELPESVNVFTQSEIESMKARLQWEAAELDKEYWTGKYHIDGRKIYGKKMELGALPNGMHKYIPHNILNIDRKTINTNGICSSPYANPPVSLNLPLVNPYSFLDQVILAIEGDDIIMFSRNDTSFYTYSLVTIEYACTDR